MQVLKLPAFKVLLPLLLLLTACGQQAAAPTIVPVTTVASEATEVPAATAAPAATDVPAPTAAPAAEADPATTLVVAIDADPQNLEPGTNKAFPIGSEIIVNVFDTLLAWKAPEFSQFEGRLAEEWTVSDDGLTYSFVLRPGVKFHDGSDFNAEAVKYSFERTLKLNPYMEAYFGSIQAITVIDPLTVDVTLKKPSAVFLSWLTMPQAAIVSPTSATEFGEQFNIHPVGTGPFVFESYTADSEVVLKANPDYWRGAPRLSGIVYRVIPDAATRRLELENGGVDVVQQNGQLFSIPVADIAALKQNPDIDVIEMPSQIIRNLDFNNNNPDSPVADIRVRQAIAYAIDYDGLVDDLLGGTANRVYGPLTESSWGFNPALKEQAFSHDLDKARALLAEAGYGPDKPLDLKLYTFQGTTWGDVGTFLQANLAEIGVNLTIEQLEFPQLREIHTSGNFDIALDGRQPWYNDPDAHITIGYLSELSGTALNFRMPADPALDQLILDAQTAPDIQARKQLYGEIQEQLFAKVPGVYLFNPKIIVYKRKNIEGLVVNSAPPLTEYWAVSKS